MCGSKSTSEDEPGAGRLLPKAEAQLGAEAETTTSSFCFETNRRGLVPNHDAVAVDYQRLTWLALRYCCSGSGHEPSVSAHRYLQTYSRGFTPPVAIRAVRQVMTSVAEVEGNLDRTTPAGFRRMAQSLFVLRQGIGGSDKPIEL